MKTNFTQKFSPLFHPILTNISSSEHVLQKRITGFANAHVRHILKWHISHFLCKIVYTALSGRQLKIFIMKSLGGGVDYERQIR